MTKKSRFLGVPVEPFEVSPNMSADEILARMERVSFQGRNLAAARRIWEKMLAGDCTIFLGAAGALSAGGMRKSPIGRFSRLAASTSCTVSCTMGWVYSYSTGGRLLF